MLNPSPPSVVRVKRPGKVRPARTAGEAYGRWALGNVAAGVGAELPAYTAEDLAHDFRVIPRRRRERTGPVARGRECPQSRPERDCDGGRRPDYYCVDWRRFSIATPPRVRPAVAVEPVPAPQVKGEPWTCVRASGGRGAALDAFGLADRRPAPPPAVARVPQAEPSDRRPVRRLVVRRTICLDCKLWIEHLAWLDFERECEMSLTFGWQRQPRPSDATINRAKELKAERSRALIVAAGGSAEGLDWYQADRLAALIDRGSRRYAKAIKPPKPARTKTAF